MIPHAKAQLWRLTFLLTVAACGGAPRGASESVEPPASPGSIAVDAERGAEVQYGPIDLQVALRVNGARRGAPRDGDIVRSGDHLQLTIQTREASHVYLAYCSRDRELTWFPPRGNILTRPNEVVIAPDPNAAIVLDDNLGPEVLYVVVSRFELSSADPELAKAIEASRQGGLASDCGQPFGGKPALPPKKPPPKRGQGASSIPRTAFPMPDEQAQGAGMKDLPGPAPTAGPGADRRPPDVGMVRGGYIGWNDLEQVTAKVDAAGIAILRYGFKHVARL